MLCVSKKREGFSGPSRLAKQDLLAQTLRIRITRMAFPLVQSTPSHSAGQDSQHGLLTPMDPQCPPGQPLNIQTCPHAALPLGPPPGPSVLGWFLRISPHPFLSFLYIPSNSGYTLSSSPSCQCRMMAPRHF